MIASPSVAGMVEVAFYAISTAAIVASGWWTVRTGKFRSLLNIAPMATPITPADANSPLKFSLRVSNVGFAQVRITEVVVVVDWTRAVDMEAGPVSAGASGRAQRLRLLNGDAYRIVPGATAEETCILRPPVGADVAVISWYLFYGRSVSVLKESEDFDRFLKRNAFYYFNTEIISLAAADARANDGPALRSMATSREGVSRRR